MDDGHVGDDVIELVLGTVDGDRRARLAAHVLRCAQCRREYDDLAATVLDLLPAVPAVQPPLGFDERVFARLTTDRVEPVAGSDRRRWQWLMAAAAAVLALLVPLGVWLVGRDDGDRSAGDVATLHRTDGTSVGTVSVSEVGGQPVMVVALVDTPSEVSYYCRVAFADGTTYDSERWPAGNGAWIVPLTGHPSTVTSVAVLPHGTERVWSEARLG